MPLKDRKVIVTGGPTIEALDPVRFITNRSTGKMGKALADEAAERARETVFIHGPVHESLIDGVDYRTLDAGKVRTLAGLGLRQLNIALVSLDGRVMETYGRRSDPGRFEEVVEAAASSGVPVTAYLIAGLRGETAASVREGLAYLAGLPVLIGISPFYAVPGISGFEDRSVFDDKPPRLCAGTAFHPWHDCSTDGLVSLFREARRINLSRKH